MNNEIPFTKKGEEQEINLTEEELEFFLQQIINLPPLSDKLKEAAHTYTKEK